MLTPANNYDTQMATLIIELLERGWTQTELARQSGTSQSYISHLSRGKGPKEGPSQSIVEALLRMKFLDLVPPPLERRSLASRMKHHARRAA